MLTLAQTLRGLRERGLENVFQRFYSFYQVEMTNSADPQQQGRAKIRPDSLGYSEEFGFADTYSPFASDDAGFFFPAYEKDQVYVTFDHGDISSPMIMGSFWKTRESKRPANSGLPAEFVNSDGSAPTKRGIKVKVGSGILFDETPEQVKVEVWTGASRGVGLPATRHHQVILDDTTGDEHILVKTKGGHQTTWRDVTGEVYVETKTIGSHQFLMDDTNEKILVKSTKGHQILINDADDSIEAMTASTSKIRIDGIKNDITLETLGQHKIIASDSEAKIEATTPLQRKLSISDLLASIKLESLTPPQTIEMNPVTGTTLTDTSPGGTTIVASAGPLLGTGQGTAFASAGGAPGTIQNSGTSTSDFQGLMTENLIGAQVKNVTGAWSVLGGFLGSINALSLLLGTGFQLRLVNEDFLSTAYGIHFHISAAAGAPTSIPVVGVGIPGIHTTIQTTAS